MKLKFLVAGWVVALAGALPAAAHINQYSTSLFGPLEQPTPNNSPGVGVAVVTLDVDTMMMRVQAGFNGLLGNVSVAHIHCCTAVANDGIAGVATPTPSFPGFPAGSTFGFYDQTFDLSLASSYNNPAFIIANGGTVGGAFSALLTGLDGGKAYFNIHTNLFPGGEIRGFLAPIPEPGTYAMMLAGLALMAVIAIRRRRQ